MITYEFLQQYWWFLIALLGGLLVFLLFVQGGNALIFCSFSFYFPRRTPVGFLILP